MAEEWLSAAKNAIHADASVAFFMCKETAEKEKINLWWVLEEFKREFERISRRKNETD